MTAEAHSVPPQDASTPAASGPGPLDVAGYNGPRPPRPSGVSDAMWIRFEHFRQPTYRPSGDSNLALWRELLRLTGEDAVRELILEKRGLESDVYRAAWIRNSIRMAEPLQRAFYDAEDEADPILLYYACMWLAKALIYANAPADVLRRRGWQFHGVKSVSLTGDFLHHEVQMKANGIVPVFCDVLGGDNIREKKIAVAELLPAIVDIMPIVEDTLGLPTVHQWILADVNQPFGPKGPRYQRMYWHSHGGLMGIPSTSFDSAVILAGLFRTLPNFSLSDEDYSGLAEWQAEAAHTYALDTYTIAGAGRERYLECRLPCGLAVPEACVMLILTHQLSEFARYHADAWLRMRDAYTKEFAIVRAFIESVYLKFPLLILNELTYRDYRFEAKTS